MKEVEVKAWIYDNDVQKISEYLEKSAEFLGEKIKNDVMYSCKNNEKKEISFRLREEISDKKKQFLVTKKTREYGDHGEEINEELEFEVTDGKQFHQFVLGLGYEVFYKKQKKVEQYRKDNILIEWVTINGLGQFLEIERVCENEEVSKALKQIMEIIIELKLENQIEKKPYGMLLGEF